MKHKKKKNDPIIDIIKEIFPDAKITQGYNATMKEMKKLAKTKNGKP
jgi:putative N-acetylmannosamine-6-phosphate epimerase